MQQSGWGATKRLDTAFEIEYDSGGTPEEIHEDYPGFRFRKFSGLSSLPTLDADSRFGESIAR
jgi:hypothetical protein